MKVVIIMYIKDKNFPIFNLAKDEKGNFVGYFNNEDLIKPFSNPTDSIFDIFLNLSKYFPEWKDCGFNTYVKKENDNKIMIQVKTKETHFDDATEIIKNNSLKLYPELLPYFEIYCKERLQTLDYIYVIIKYKDKEDRCAINKNGTTIKLVDISGFLKQYAYYPEIKYVPKKISTYEDLIKKSIIKRQDCLLNIFLKESTTLTEDKILNFQECFRNDMNEFVFEKNNIEHLTYLINYIKTQNPTNKSHNLVSILYAVNGYTYNKEKNTYTDKINSSVLNYIIGIKDYLKNLIIADNDCINDIINTDFISNEKRKELIQNNIDLIQYLNSKYQDIININLIKTFLNTNINNLRFIDIDVLLKKDVNYTISLINEFLQQDRRVDNISFIDILIKKYITYVTDNTFGICLNNTPITKLSEIFSLNPKEQFIPLIINKFNENRITYNDTLFKENINNLILTLNNHNYNYDVIYEPLTDDENSDLIIYFIDKLTGQKIDKMEEPELSNSLSKNKETNNKNHKLTNNQPKTNTKKPQQTNNNIITEDNFLDELLNEIEDNNLNISNNEQNKNNIKDTNISVQKEKDDESMITSKDESTQSALEFYKSISDKLEYPPESYCTEDWCVEFEKENFKAYEDMKKLKEQKIKESVESFRKTDNLPEMDTTSDCLNRFLMNFFENDLIDDTLLDPNKEYTKTAVSIDIIQKPHKLNYIQSEHLNTNGIELLVKYNDGSNETITSIEPINEYADINNPFIIIEYQSIKKEIPITIEDKKPISITIVKKPYKLDYIQGEEINLDGIEVEAKYNNLSTEIIDNYKYDLIDNSINIYYANLAATIPITITASKVIALKIVRHPDKTNYFDNEKIDLTGLIIEALYNNNTRKKITDYETSISNSRVTITYENISTSFSVNITPIKVTKLEILTNPYKTEYFKGESFNPDGLILKAYFNNKTYTNITDIRVTPKIYKDSVTIQYKNATIDIPITLLRRKVEKLSLISPPLKTVYEKNEVFDPTGLKIAKEYNDKSTEELSSFDYTPKCALTPDDKKITIYYDIYTLDIPISVRGKTFKSKNNRKIKEPTKELIKDTTKEQIKETTKEVTKESQISEVTAETTKEESPSPQPNKQKKGFFKSILQTSEKEKKAVQEDKSKKKEQLQKPSKEKSLLDKIREEKSEELQKNEPFSRLSSDKSDIINVDDSNRENKIKNEGSVLEKLKKNETITQEDLKKVPLDDIINNIIS